MKQFIIRFISIVLFAGISAQSFAMPPKPANCPNAMMIRAAGLAHADLDEGTYLTFQIHNYGTPQIWMFGIDGIQANSDQEALGIGYQALSSVFGNPTPIPVTSENVWACLYYNNFGLLSMAFTPLPLSKFNKAFKLQTKA